MQNYLLYFCMELFTGCKGYKIRTMSIKEIQEEIVDEFSCSKIGCSAMSNG